MILKVTRFYSTMICDLFFASLYFIFFHWECMRISNQGYKMLSNIGNWYIEEKHAYLRIFGSGSPHFFPTYVTDKLVLGEICYQNILQGFNSSLIKDKYHQWKYAREFKVWCPKCCLWLGDSVKHFVFICFISSLIVCKCFSNGNFVKHITNHIGIRNKRQWWHFIMSDEQQYNILP